MLSAAVSAWSPDFPRLHPFEHSSRGRPADWRDQYRARAQATEAPPWRPWPRTITKSCEDDLENPPNDALRRLAELYQQGRMQELLQAGQPLMLQFPNSAPLLTLVGAAHLSSGKFSQARAAFAK